MCNSSLPLRPSLCRDDLGKLYPLPETIGFLPRPSGLQALVLEQGADHSATLKLDPRSSRGDAPSSVGPSKRNVYLAKDAAGSTCGNGRIEAKHRTSGDGPGSLVPELGLGVEETASHCGRKHVSRF